MDTTWRTTGLTNQQVMDRLAVGIRTVQGYAKAGRLRHTRDKRGEAGQWVTVYHPDDVAELATDRQPGPATAFLVPGTPPNGHGHSAGLQASPPPAVDPDQVRALAALVVAVAVEVRSQGPQGAQGAQEGAQSSQPSRIYLTVREAAAFTGLRPTFLKRMIDRGTLTAVTDGRVVKVRRKDLEAL